MIKKNKATKPDNANQETASVESEIVKQKLALEARRIRDTNVVFKLRRRLAKLKTAQRMAELAGN